MSSLPYVNAAAFRQALLTRLKLEATVRGVSMQSLQQRLLMERMLVRLFRSKETPWVLKGGFALDLRFRPQVRATRDLDLGVRNVTDEDNLRDCLETAMIEDPGDFLKFTLGRSSLANEGKAIRFGVRVGLAGKELGGFSLDVALDDPRLASPQKIQSDENLGIEGLTPATSWVLDLAQHFAEKLHALTFDWLERENTRVKDLVDLVLLVERANLKGQKVALAIRDIFQHRQTHPVPTQIDSQPANWTQQYVSLAHEAGLHSLEMKQGLESLRHWLKRNEVLEKAFF